MNKIEHIGIAVCDLNEAVKRYGILFNTDCYKRELVESQKVETAFFKTGPNKIELLGATSPDSVITKFIENRGEGLHHIAFDVEDIYAEMKRLKAEDFELLQDQPVEGADNKLIAFLHPKSTNGVLLELCMEKPGN